MIPKIVASRFLNQGPISGPCAEVPTQAVATPTPIPSASCSCHSMVAVDAATKAAMSINVPIAYTARGPKRSTSAPAKGPLMPIAIIDSA